MDCKKMLEEQIRLLADWNKDWIKNEPEQVRKNVETINNAISLLLTHPR